MSEPIEILVDADACPVKDEVFRVAARYGLKTYVVSNSFMMLPRNNPPNSLRCWAKAIADMVFGR